MVEFGESSLINLEHFHPVATARGTLGLITLNNDVFLCVVTGSEEVAKVRPSETVQKIFAVEFCEFAHLTAAPEILIPCQTVSTVRTMTMHMALILTHIRDRAFTRTMSITLKATMLQSIHFMP